MAEVRPIPSAVGAFEAQVFNLSRTSQIMQQNLMAKRKFQNDLRKDAEKKLAELGSLKSKGRTQDLTYLGELYKKANDYYSQNSAKIQPGTNEYNEFNDIISTFEMESRKSMNEKESDKDWASWMASNATKQRASDKSAEAWKIKQLPINDPNRASYQFEKKDGTKVDIAQVGLPDLEKLELYDEEDTRKAIQGLQNVPVSTDVFVSNYMGKKMLPGTILKKKMLFKTPSQIIQAFDTQYNSKIIDATPYYDKEWSNLSPTEQADINARFANINKIYAAAGIKETVNIDGKDGIAGISNGYEYGVAKFLLQNLPIEAGADIDLSMASLLQSRSQFNRRMNMIAKSRNPGQNYLTTLINNLNNPNFDVKTYLENLNPLISYAGVGSSFAPTKYSVDNKTKNVKLTTNTMLFDVNGSPIQNASQAIAAAGLSNTNFMWDKRNRAGGAGTKGLVKDSKTNVWYLREETSYDLNPQTNPDYAGAATNIMNQTRNSFNSNQQGQKDFLDAFLQSKGTVSNLQGAAFDF